MQSQPQSGRHHPQRQHKYRTASPLRCTALLPMSRRPIVAVKLRVMRRRRRLTAHGRRSCNRSRSRPVRHVRRTARRSRSANVRCIRPMSVDNALNPLGRGRIEARIESGRVQGARLAGGRQRTHDIRQNAGEKAVTDERRAAIDVHLRVVALFANESGSKHYFATPIPPTFLQLTTHNAPSLSPYSVHVVRFLPFIAAQRAPTSAK